MRRQHGPADDYQEAQGEREEHQSVDGVCSSSRIRRLPCAAFAAADIHIMIAQSHTEY